MDYTNLISGNRLAFLSKIQKVCNRLNIQKTWLLDVIFLESTFDPTISNGIGAVGLLQFTRSTCIDLGVTPAQVLQMSAVDQLDLVERYFEMRIRQHGQPESFEDLYCLVFYPPWMGAADTATLPRSAYIGNYVFDSDKDGFITKGEFFKRIWKRLGKKKV